MTVVFVITGEHPNDPWLPLEVFADSRKADERAAVLTREFLTEAWDVVEAGEPPEVTIQNWPALVERFGFRGDDQGYGRWFVDLRECEVRS